MKRVLIRGGTIISMDKRVRDLPQGDVLIEPAASTRQPAPK
jgi:hypothetical protein